MNLEFRILKYYGGYSLTVKLQFVVLASRVQLPLVTPIKFNKMSNTSFKLTILGAGVIVPTKNANPAGFLVEANGKKILLDCGHGTIRHLIDYGFNVQDINLVFISHFHTDHFGDAFNLVHTRWVDDCYKQNGFGKLTFLGPETLEKRFKKWRTIFWPEPKEYYNIKFLEGPRKIKLEKISIEIFPVKHVKWFKSIGIIIKYQNKKIVYTGDIGSDHDYKDLVKRCSGSDLLIAEASYDKPTPNHYSIGQIKELAKKDDIKKVLVVHYRPQHAKYVEQVCKKEKKFIFGKDGLKLEI